MVDVTRRRISAADVGLARANKYHARRALACRTCGIIVEADSVYAGPVKSRHIDPARKCKGQLEKFDSKGEARTFIALAQAEHAGYIEALELQPVFVLRAEGGVKVGTYRGDFRFVCDGRQRVIDVKGVSTPLYRFKKRFVEAAYGLEIEEWKPGETAL